MILYFDSAKLDSDRDGVSNMTSSDKRSYPDIPGFYYLGKVEGRHAYGTTTGDKIPAPALDTLAQMADRLDELRTDPPIFGRESMIADIAARMRKVVLTPATAPASAAFVKDSQLPDGPPPTGPLPAMAPLADFNNGKPANGAAWFGASLGDDKYDGNGWPKDSDTQAMIDLGVATIRFPIRMRYCIGATGALNAWVINYMSARIKYAMARGVAVVLDAHEYKPFSDTRVANFWMLFAAAMEKAIGGPNPMFGVELSNEPNSGSKDLAEWTEPLRTTIKAIRVSGYQGYIFAGSGDWNNATFLPKALLEVERAGGAVAMDPFNRTIYTMHDYWNKDISAGKTRNDQGAFADGTIDIAKRYDPALAVARRLGVKVCMSEIGGGISPNGPLPAYNGVGKNGRQLQDEYFAYAKANRDALIGTWFWMGGKVKADYRHKIEAGNEHTKHLQSGLWGA